MYALKDTPWVMLFPSFAHLLVNIFGCYKPAAAAAEGTNNDKTKLPEATLKLYLNETQKNERILQNCGEVY